MLTLMRPNPSLPSDHPLLCYQYSESDKWASSEIDAFHQALLKHDKDFHYIAQDVTHNMKICIMIRFICDFVGWHENCETVHSVLLHMEKDMCG